jgi:hypothetical protein
MNKNKEVNFYKLGKDSVFPLTPDAQHIFDEVVLDRKKSHLDQIHKWYFEDKPNLIINIIGEDCDSILLNNWK